MERLCNTAVAHGHIQMVKWLLDYGAETDVPDYQGKRPLKVAKEKGYSEIAALLVQHGAVE